MLCKSDKPTSISTIVIIIVSSCPGTRTTTDLLYLKQTALDAGTSIFEVANFNC